MVVGVGVVGSGRCGGFVQFEILWNKDVPFCKNIITCVQNLELRTQTLYLEVLYSMLKLFTGFVRTRLFNIGKC